MRESKVVDAQRISRRRFLKYTGAVAAGVIIGGTGIILLTSTPKRPAQKLRIGAIFSLTGPVAAWGVAGQQGALMAIEEINRAGGILGMDVEFKIEDDQARPDVGVRKARSLVADWGANFLIGINSSGVALAVTAILPELKTILAIPCAAAPSVTNEKFNKFVFRTKANSYQLSKAGAIIAAELLPSGAVVTTTSPDYAYGREAWDAFSSNLKTLRPDVKVLGKDKQGWPKLFAGEYSSHITTVLEAKPDCVFSAFWGGDMATFVKQANLFKFFDKVKFFFTEAGLAVDVFYALGKEIPDNLWSAAHGYWFEAAQPGYEKSNREFVSKFLNRYGVYPHVTAHDTYAEVHMIRRVLEKAGSLNVQEVIRAFEGLGDFDSPAYRKRIRPLDHQVISDVPWGRVAPADDLPFGKRLTDIRNIPGEKVLQPEEEVKRLRA